MFPAPFDSPSERPLQSKFIYTLNAGTGAIGIFSADRDGSVLSLGTVDGLPAAAGLNGIAAF